MHLILQIFSINEAQCLMRLILAVQQSLLDLRSNLTAISSTASKGQDEPEDNYPGGSYNNFAIRE